MIEKYSRVLAFDPVHGQQVFVLSEETSFEKTASILKESQVSPEIQEAINGLKREPGHAYVLVNAMGAYEFWGPNRNHDAFPETGLKFGGDDYGYRTFKTAYVNLHHDNKDPARSVGRVKTARYNNAMHRIELLVDVDMRKVAERDPEIYKKLAAGEPTDWSMGSKCDFDIATCCGHKAATRAEYCECLRKYGGQIMPDGRRVCAYTPHPRFFDISAVTKGADVTAKALHYLDKAAAEGASSPPKKEEDPACPDPSLHEAVSCEASFEEPKFAEAEIAAVRVLEAVEERIPGKILAAMAKVGFHETLSTLSHFGVVLSPEEYQHVTLSAMGHQDVAEKMAAEGAVIDPVAAGSWHDPQIQIVSKQTDPENIDAKVALLAADYVAKRSIFEPYFSERLAKAASLPRSSAVKLAAAHALRKDAASFMTPELAAALALGYIVYRKGIPTAEIEAVRKAVRDPEMAKKVVMVLVPLIAAGSVIDRVLGFEPYTNRKTAGAATEVLLPVAGTYLYSAYARRKAERGEPISGIEHMFAEYPLPISVGGIAGLQAIKHRLKGTLGKRSGMILDGSRKTSEMKKQATAGADLLLAIGSGIYRPRVSGVLGYLADLAVLSGVVAGVKRVAEAVSDKTSEAKI